jgi:putative ubiquitin-RnfH superfamily antitoxin RatB of RatAB toxin-antitoxin module
MHTTIVIEVIEAHESTVSREKIALPRDARVRDALAVCKLAQASAALQQMQTVGHTADSVIGIWGRRVLLDTALNNDDRIELYRAVTADAKSARLARAREQGYRWQGRTRRAASVAKVAKAETP